MAKILGNISSIETGFVDGPGVRAVVFMQGCPLRCLYCHNPETWEVGDKNLLTPEEVVQKVKRYKSYFGKEGGVTFSGGEPLLQPQFLLETLKLCKKEGFHTALDTAGTGKDYEELLDYVDLVILDVKATTKDQYKALTGGEITALNAFIDKIQKKGLPLWIRQVIVPNINDTENDVLRLKQFVSKIANVQKIELLGYHDMAKSKYEKLGIIYKLKDTPPMDKEKLNNLQSLLK